MRYFYLIFMVLIFSACSNEHKKEEKLGNNTTQKEKKVVIKSIHELNEFFKDMNYTSTAWALGNREVPRMYFDHVRNDWKQTSKKLPVKEKKSIFFRLLAPLVLISNEEILKDRKKLLSEAENSEWTLKLAKQYRVVEKSLTKLNKNHIVELKKRVDIIPMSLALAQGAEESGWGTSRFASEGNALFGLWDYSGKGMAPTRQRKELGNYGLARYDTPLDSVKGYMFNINIGHAYEKLRTMRQNLRQDDKKITGWELATTLDKYSERGQAYIDGLHNMMKYNKLSAADDAYLSNGVTLHIVTSN